MVYTKTIFGHKFTTIFTATMHYIVEVGNVESGDCTTMTQNEYKAVHGTMIFICDVIYELRTLLYLRHHKWRRVGFVATEMQLLK